MQEHEAIARLKQGDIHGLETLVRLYQGAGVSGRLPDLP